MPDDDLERLLNVGVCCGELLQQQLTMNKYQIPDDQIPDITQANSLSNEKGRRSIFEQGNKDKEYAFLRSVFLWCGKMDVMELYEGRKAATRPKAGMFASCRENTVHLKNKLRADGALHRTPSSKEQCLL